MRSRDIHPASVRTPDQGEVLVARLASNPKGHVSEKERERQGEKVGEKKERRRRERKKERRKRERKRERRKEGKKERGTKKEGKRKKKDERWKWKWNLTEVSSHDEASSALKKKLPDNFAAWTPECS